MRKPSYCNHRKPFYFLNGNLENLYNLFDDRLSLELSKYILRTPFSVNYDTLWNDLRRSNLALYNRIRDHVENYPEATYGNIKTKMYFATGRQYYSSIQLLSYEQKRLLLSVIGLITRRTILNPTVLPSAWIPRWMENNGMLHIPNSHNIGNLRTGINHLINEGLITVDWANYDLHDFTHATIRELDLDKLFTYHGKVLKSISKPDLDAKTDREFGFERIIRDIIHSDLQGKSINGINIPTFISYKPYQHHLFETDILAESRTQRWIIEVSTGHQDSRTIRKKFFSRKAHFNSTLGVKDTVGLFIANSHGIIDGSLNFIHLLKISDFKNQLNSYNIRDTLTCFNF